MATVKQATGYQVVIPKSTQMPEDALLGAAVAGTDFPNDLESLELRENIEVDEINLKNWDKMVLILTTGGPTYDTQAIQEACDRNNTHLKIIYYP